MQPHDEPFCAERWSAYLTLALGRHVRVRFGRARVRVLEARSERGGAMTVRMSALFASAPPEVRDSVAAWLRSGRRARAACRTLDAWIDAATAALPSARPRAEQCVAAGAVHDLAELSSELRATCFPPTVLEPERWPALTWGRRGRRRARHSLRLGSFEPDTSLVRVNPVLDQAAVPRWFVRYILFHELLHAVLPPRPGPGGRTIHHGPEFRRRERAYADYDRALAWQDSNLRALIRSARTGVPMRVPANQRVPAKQRAAATRRVQAQQPAALDAKTPAPKSRRGAIQRLLFPD